MSQEKRVHFAEELEKEKSQKLEPAKEKKSEQKPKSRKKTCCWLGAILGILLLIVIFNSPVLRGIFSSSGDVVRTPTANSPTPVSATPSYSSENTNSSNNYPQPGACEHLSLVSSVPLEINANNPGLHQDIATHYYQVYGYTPYEVRQQLSECGAKTPEGEIFDAYTSWYANWTYNYTSTATSCSIKDVTVGLKVDYFYPKWEDPGNAEAGLAQRWQNYMSNLIVHENGHGQNGLNAGQDILSALSSLPTVATCNDLISLVDSTARNVASQHTAWDTQYDDSTNHGATQGAAFP